ncbi:methyltransferase domain-containing protein [Paenibacillus sp. alder61]|uniref:class I SAM-dependent methyltransferase n=1 Tax=Paenibacillus sp. alder61 TaxID=2862948 RepID=UPI001CD1FC57|nr:methyltransferase domain-containing protein [Paenibacillus sp. alder61]MCA1295206.1 methyltransferase domain-containing protein [Paenibacillus sp. alder61]
MKSNNNLLFLRSFVKNPKNVGSIIPSSRFLANAMVKQVAWNGVTAVAELGSGTGAITRYIHQKANGKTKVFLFEMDQTMRDNLTKEYPAFTSHPNAAALVNSIKAGGVEHLDCIFSGLPFFNFERTLRNTLMEQIYQALKPGGLFIAFQYSLQMKKQLSENFIIEKIEFVPLNIPPAFVYVCRKKESNE